MRVTRLTIVTALLALLAAANAPPAPAQSAPAQSAPAQSGDPSFNLLNRSGQPIREIYVSPVQERFWGRDLLGAETLPDGRSFPVRLAPSLGCEQDVRVVYADGRDEERRGQNTCAMTTMVFGTAPQAGQRATPRGGQQAGNPSFNLVNHGNGPIREVYVSSVRETVWGEDRLGADVLPPGRHLPVRLAVDACENDVRIVWMDGRSEERRGIDTCRLINLVFP
jgi:hypothetical protein